MALGDNIKKRRKELDLTLEDVAKHVQVSRQTIQKYENGIVSNVPSDKVERLAEVLRTSPAWLMGWEEKTVEIIPGRLKFIEVNDPKAEDIQITLEAADKEAYEFGLKILEDSKVLTEEGKQMMLSYMDYLKQVALKEHKKRNLGPGKIEATADVKINQN